MAESSFMPENVLSEFTSGREQSSAIILVWDAMVFFRCNISPEFMDEVIGREANFKIEEDIVLLWNMTK